MIGRCFFNHNEHNDFSQRAQDVATLKFTRLCVLSVKPLWPWCQKNKYYLFSKLEWIFNHNEHKVFHKGHKDFVMTRTHKFLNTKTQRPQRKKHKLLQSFYGL
ncbi:hypothetical protein AM493_19755 [Flavobacterium akiainvivens]|uniref:Uncharacterized protein n=1 Tax=Flavobacterium akiainvivens TaxID=1202724 RepID=A0A0M8MDN7_9FLAO|nr:hypothetical protein AM493_19755 [Flavobacterium akiainvivens]